MDWLKKQIFTIDGFTLTVGGAAAILIVAYLLFWRKR